MSIVRKEKGGRTSWNKPGGKYLSWLPFHDYISNRWRRQILITMLTSNKLVEAEQVDTLRILANWRNNASCDATEYGSAIGKPHAANTGCSPVTQRIPKRSWWRMQKSITILKSNFKLGTHPSTQLNCHTQGYSDATMLTTHQTAQLLDPSQCMDITNLVEVQVANPSRRLHTWLRVCCSHCNSRWKLEVSSKSWGKFCELLCDINLQSWTILVDQSTWG